MSKKKGILKALTGLTLFLWLFSGSVGYDDVSNYQDERYEIRLKSRYFVPEEELPISVSVMDVEFYQGRTHLLMQFDEIPDRETQYSLEELGVRFLNYIPNRSWFVSVPINLSFDFPAMSGVRWAGRILPDDKLSSAVRDAARGDMTLVEDGRIELTVKYFDDVDPSGLRNRLVSSGSTVISESVPLKSIFIAALPAQILAIARDDSVRWIEPIGPPFKPESDRVRSHIQVDPAQSAGFTGNGIRVGVFDLGHVDNTHGDLSPRVSLADTPGQPVNIPTTGDNPQHATLVAGTVGGNGSQSASQPCGWAQRWRGMAPAVSIYSYDYTDNNDAAMRTNFSNDLLHAINTNDIEIANNSWGTPGCDQFSYGDYVGLCSFLDEEVYYSASPSSKPRIIVFSAGNERNKDLCGNSTTAPYLNYGTMNHPKSAKNIIAVGAIDSDNNRMTTYSSWGPTSDGRIKPEVVASGHHDGTNVSGVSELDNPFGTAPCWIDGNNYRTTGYMNGYVYGWFCATSHAAAATSGSIALILEDYYNVHGSPPPLASTIKALLIQTAQDLDNATSWYNKGPDYASGYGLIRINDARQLMHNSGFVEGHLDPDQPNWPRDVTYRFTVPGGASSVKVTLAWDDYPAADNADPALVNDLDLILRDPNGTIYYPWTLNPNNPSASATRLSEDHVNNVEQVYVDSGIVSGTWTATVIAETIPSHPQEFSLAGYVFSTCPRPDTPSISYPSVDCDHLYTVNWTSVPGATSYDFESDDNPQFSSPQSINTTATNMNFVPPAGNHVYYHRVRSKNECGTSFWDEGGPIVIGSPPIPTNPFPPNGANNVPIGSDLDWNSCPGTDSYDVYFGTASPPPFAGNVTSSNYDPGTLNTSTTYFWRVNPRNICGETTGPIWSFTTEGGITGPQITNITPPKASAGTNTEVTIDGLNFGSTQGSSTVEFFHRTGEPKLEASINSWSATEIRCTVPRNASSGPVTVTTSSGTSNEYTFRVSFGYKGEYWPDSHPYVEFRVNENAPDCTGESDVVIAAANEWNRTCASFTFVYDGATSATAPSQNGHNEIFWGTVSTGALASFNAWYVNSNQLVEFDLVLNETFPWSTNAESGHHDIQNVMTALFGYSLGLTLLFGDEGSGDDTEKTMYYWADLGETKKRTLHADDIAGIQWIYNTGGDAWDPADDAGTGATQLIPTGSWQYHGRHTFTPCDRYDWYRISMTAGETYYLESSCDFDAGYDGDVVAYLFSDPNGDNSVDADDDSGGNLQFSITYTPSVSGNYYLRVERLYSDAVWSGFIEYRSEPQIISISGQVTLGGLGLAGVVMSGLPGNPTTDASGNYAATVNHGWSGSVTPTLAGYSFNPPSRTYSNVTTNRTGEDYTAAVLTYTISGQVTHGGLGLAGVVMSGLPGSPTTDALGNYTATVDHGWSGTVVPVLTPYLFNPPSRTYTGVTSNQTSQDYTATTIPYTISGRVTEGGSGLEGVVMNGLPGSPLTNPSGDYTAAVASGWSGTVTPALSGYRFTPASRTYTNVTSDQTDEDYSATPLAEKDDLLGTWTGQGAYYRNSDTGEWVYLGSPATQVTAGDLDNDGTDDLIGIWPGQGGVWVKYSSTGTWDQLSTTADWISAGDMNGDGIDDLIGTWTGQGVYYLDSATSAWKYMGSPATQVTAGDLDNDGTDDLIGIWPGQGGVWVKYSSTNTWDQLSSTADWISDGDMNGDGIDDLIGTWTGQGVYYLDSATGSWVYMGSPATQVTGGDLDGDSIDDFVGIWPGQGGVWVKYSSTMSWEKIASTPDWIACGKMRD